MILYLMGLLIVVPILLAGFFWLNRNSLLQKVAVFFMAGILVLATGWAVGLRNGSFSIPDGIAAFELPLWLAGNLAVIAAVAYLSGLARSRLGAGLFAIQVILIGWLGVQAGAGSPAGGFLLDHLSVLMLLVINGVGALTLLFAKKYMELHERRQGMNSKHNSLFFAAAALLLAAMNGLVLTNHLIGILFFWQSLILCSFILIVHDRTEKALQQGRGFVRQQMIGGIGFLAGAIWLQAATRTLIISDLLVFGEATLLVGPLACIILAGLVATSQFPFQTGLLRATLVPLPGAVLLQTVALVNAGLYLILRLSPLYMNTWLAKILLIIGAFSFAAAALLALMQHEVKRIFGFTTISIAGLTIALACLANLQALYAAVLLVVLQGMTKALLLLCTGGNSQSRLSAGLALLAAMAMVMPPFGIPLAQWVAFEASLHNPVALVLMIAGSVFSLLVWARFIGRRLAVFTHSDTNWKTDLLYAVPQFVLAAGIVLSGFLSMPFINVLITPVLKENYRRFGDIAQGDAASFLIRDFAGINPLLVFAVLAAVVGPGWLLLRWLACRSAVKNAAETADTAEDKDVAPVTDIAEQPAVAEDKAGEVLDAPLAVEMCDSEAAVGEAAANPAEISHANEARPEVSSPEPQLRVAASMVPHFPTRSILSLFPDESRTQLYATIIGGALIFLMFEVVIR